MLILLSILGCEQLTPWLEEVREPPTSVFFGGSVYETPPITDLVEMEEGSVEFFDLEGELLAEAAQPFESSPGYWRAELPPGEPFHLRVESSRGVPTMWRGAAPEGHGTWFSGAVFGFEREFTEDFLGELAGALEIEWTPFEELEGCHLWGNLADRDSASLEGLGVVDGEGSDVELVAFEINEDGLLVQSENGPIDLFFAFDLAPGVATLSLTGEGGEVHVDYPCEAGAMLAPWWMEVP